MVALSETIALSSMHPVRRSPKPTFDRLFRLASYGSALLVLIVLAGILASMIVGGWPAFERLRPWLSHLERVGCRAGPVRRLRRHRRHPDVGPHRPRHRRPGLARHRGLPDPALPGLAEAAGVDDDRASGRGARASSTACGACSSSRRCSQPMCRSRSRALVEGVPDRRHRALCPRALRRRHPHRRDHPGHHDHPVHRLDRPRHPRPDPDGPARERLWHRLHDLGGRAACARAAGRGQP